MRASLGSQPGGPQSYGSSNPADRPTPPLKRRRHVNALAVAVGLLLPWALFVLIFAVMSFSVHYQHVQLCWFVVALGALVTAGWGLMAFNAARRRRAGDVLVEPTWHVFVAATLFLGWALGLLLGSVNFRGNMQRYYDVTNLNTYPGVDPAKTHGQQLLDAGRVIFTRSSTPDVMRSASFKNVDTYCVAPITSTQDKLASYDFWAVGTNCCSSSQLDFHCWGSGNQRAHAGMRMMDGNKWEYFRLAVQQAEAEHKIRTTMPLFFHWVEDPIGEMNALQDAGLKYFILGTLMFFALQLFLVIVSSMGFSQLNAC